MKGGKGVPAVFVSKKEEWILRERRGEDQEYRAWIFKILRSPEIDSKESIPPAYVAWRAGTITLFLLGS
jgi:hypothetical protein